MFIFLHYKNNKNLVLLGVYRNTATNKYGNIVTSTGIKNNIL